MLRVGDPVDPGRLVGQRWFASAGAVPVHAMLEERFRLTGGAAIGLVRVALASGATARYLMPLDDRPQLWLDLFHVAMRGGAVEGDAGWSLMGVPTPAAPAVGPGGRGVLPGPTAGADVRPLGIDQSNTSVVLGATWVLKLYRRVVPGRNPEAELSAALATVAGAPVPDFVGAVRLVRRGGTSGPRHAADIAIVQRFVPGAGDEFERFAETLAARLRAGRAALDPGARPDELHEDIARAGSALAALHGALAGLRGRGLEPRPVSAADRERWMRQAVRHRDAAVRALRRLDPTLSAEVLAARPEIDARLRPLGRVPPTARLTRIHGDFHLGQLIRDGDRYLVGDLEGEPTRSLASRRHPDLPLRDVASMLRSIDHVARSAARRAGITDAAGHPDPVPVDPWLRAARQAFLLAYRGALPTAGEPPGVDPALLHALEVEKELYEFTYAANYLPAWRYAPAGGLRWLLQQEAP